MDNIGERNDYNNTILAGMPSLIGDGTNGQSGVMVSTEQGVPARVANDGMVGGDCSDDDSIDEDYASTHASGKIDNLEDAMQAIEQLSKQINVVKRENMVKNILWHPVRYFCIRIIVGVHPLF